MPSSKFSLISVGLLSFLTVSACSSSKPTGTGGGTGADTSLGGDCAHLDFTKYPTDSTVSFGTDVMPILAEKCSGISCHNSSHMEAGLSLGAASTTGMAAPLDAPTIAAVYANLVSVPAKTVTTGDVMRVNPGHPETSFLIDKLSGVQNDKGLTCKNQDPSHSIALTPLACGDDMPASENGTGGLCGDSPDKFDTIVKWIVAGAKNN